MHRDRYDLASRTHNRTHLLAWAALTAVGLAAPGALAATATWNGAGADSNWTTDGNWVGGAKPLANDLLVFSGPAIVNNNDFAAGTQFNGISFAAGSGAFTLSGNAINLGGSVVNLDDSTQTIGLGLTLLQGTTFNASTAAITVNGGLSGVGFGLTKVGLSTLTLGTTASTYTGATRVQQGTLALSFANATAAANLISSSSALELGGLEGGVFLAVTSKNSTNNTQAFNGTTVKSGQSTITLARGNTSGSMSLDLGGITRQAGGLLHIAQGTNGTLGSTVHVDGSGTVVNGILGGWATYGSNWATISGTDVVAYSAYTIPAGTAPVIAGDAASNVRVSNMNAKTAPTGVVNTSGSAVITMDSTAGLAAGDVLTGTGVPLGATIVSVDSPTQITISAVSSAAVTTFAAYALVTMSAAGVTDVHTLQVNDANSRILNIGSGNTLRLGPTGGLWKSTTTANRLLITGGSLTAGGANNTAGELIVRADSSGTVIDSSIINNGTGTVSLTKSGTGEVVLAGSNSYTGGTHIYQGRLTATSTNGFGSGNVYVYSASANAGEAHLASGGDYTNNFYLASPSVGANTLMLGNNSGISGDIHLTGNATIRAVASANGVSTLSGVIDANGHVITFGNTGAQGTSNTIVLMLKEGSDLSSGVILSQPSSTGGSTILVLGEHQDNANPLTWSFASLDFNNVRTASGSGNRSEATVRLNGLDLTVEQITTSAVNVNTKGYVLIQNSGAAADDATLTVRSGRLRGALQNGHASAVLNLVKEGAGTFSLATYYTNQYGGESRSTYTGSTVINGGVLEIDNIDLTSARVTSTSGITVNTNGTFRFTQSGITASTDRIGNAVPITLNGGKLDLNGLSEGAPDATGIGVLTVAANSTIDFGAGSSLVTFAGVAQTLDGAVLIINNWNGDSPSGGGPDRLMFAGDAADFTALFSDAEVNFVGYQSGYNATQYGSFYEITPTSVPEPGMLSLLGLGGLGLMRRRRRS